MKAELRDGGNDSGGEIREQERDGEKGKEEMRRDN